MHGRDQVTNGDLGDGADGGVVVLVARDEQHVKEAAGRLGERAVGLVADVTDPSTPSKLVAAARREFGGLHGAFVSHGGPSPGHAFELDDERLRRALELATIGPIRLVRELAAELDEGDAIVVLTSSTSREPIPGLATSNIARTAVWGFVKTIADEVAPRGIRVNALLPGRFLTERIIELEEAQAQREGTTPEEVRRRQLECYLEERRHRAKILFIAEALGYQGGHFTGIAMTSERILLGYQHEKYGIQPGHVFCGAPPQRTSNPRIIENGMSEPTATIMWGTLIDLGIDPYDVVLWNAVPWHPYKPEAGFLSNRTPTPGEMEAGFRHLSAFIQLFDGNVSVIAVGRKCEQSLTELGILHTGVRHPANGGAPRFRKQVSELMMG